MCKAKKKWDIRRLLSGKTAVLTCIVVAMVFLAVINLLGFITDCCLGDCSPMIKKMISEGMIAAFAMLLLKFTAGFKRLHGGDFSYLRRIRRKPMLPALVIAVIIQVFRALNGHTIAELRNAKEILAFVLFVTFVGIAEEAVFRGVIAESMLCTFGGDEEGKHFAALVSGVIFGMAHLQNINGADVTGVLVQSAGASVVGILFAEVYYTFRSLKLTIILHAGIDFFAALEFGLFENVSISQIVSTYSPLMVIPYAAIFIAWMGHCKSESTKRVCA